MDRAGGLRWTDRANWHITLAFYGEVDAGLLDGLYQRLARAAGRGHPLRLRIAGGGRFGDRTLWAAVTGAAPDADAAEPEGEAAGEQDGEALRRFAATTVAAGRRLGLGTDEPGRFHAHLTLARVRAHRLDLRPFAAALKDFAGEPWTAGELALVRSNLPGSGVQGEQPRYEQVAGWPLGG